MGVEGADHARAVGEHPPRGDLARVVVVHHRLGHGAERVQARAIVLRVEGADRRPELRGGEQDAQEHVREEGRHGSVARNLFERPLGVAVEDLVPARGAAQLVAQVGPHVAEQRRVVAVSREDVAQGVLARAAR